MSAEKQIDAAAEEIAELAERRAPQAAAKAEKPQRQLSADQVWARKNLRWRDGKPICDIANCLRVLERHQDFTGYYRYDHTLRRVTDRGAVMLDWRIVELTATIQERFIPEAPVEDVTQALTVASIRSQAK